MDRAVLQLTDIHKSFGGAPALRGARLEVVPGEIHGLVGENGAGKSTLINIATGLLKPDSGGIELSGSSVALHGPQHAASLGVAVVHQESDLFAQLSIAENMLLGKGLVRKPGGLVDWPGTYKQADQLVESMGEQFDVRATAGGLTVARRMISEIASAVGSGGAKVLFLDEPTASLTLREIDRLFERIRALRDSGVGIVYVSHRLEEVLTLCGRVTIMRDGQTIETLDAATCSIDRLVSGMVGRELTALTEHRPSTAGEERLVVSGASDALGQFKDVSLSVRAGEIVGVYGFVGAGRSELGQALFGLEKLAAGTVTIDGKTVRATSPRQAVAAGIAYLPEDRLVQGVFRTHALRTNASVATLQRLCKGLLVSGKAEREQAAGVMREMRVRAENAEQSIGTLSGGNQQKVVFGRWQCANPRVLILDEPTRGVDVGAKAEIHRLIGELADRGCAVLVISSDLPEVVSLSDRVLTMSEGRLTGSFDPVKDGEKAIAAAAVPRSSASDEAAVPEAAGRPIWSRLSAFGLVGFIAALAIAMSILKPHEFANPRNFLDMMADMALPGIVAQGAILVICAGGIDISIGSMVGLTCAVAALAAKAGVPPGLVVLLAAAMGTGLSLLNAGTSLLARIHPIIVTLAGISIYRGIQQAVMGGSVIYDLPDSYRALALGNVLGVPRIALYVVAVTAVIHVLLRHTLIGRQVLALGGSETAARLIGLSRTKLTLFVFGISGALVGLTSVLTAGYYGNVQANTGEGLEMKAIAAAVIGGTNIMGGRGSAVGGLLGAFLVAMVYNALVLLKVNPYWQNLFVGSLILLAVTSDVLSRGRRRAR